LPRAAAQGFRVLPKPYSISDLAAALRAASEEAGVAQGQLQISI